MKKFCSVFGTGFNLRYFFLDFKEDDRVGQIGLDMGV